MSFITCEPTSNVPTQPRSTHVQGFTSRRTKNSDTSCQLPGGKIAENRAPRSSPVFPISELLISPTATNRMEKNARNMLKATACETIPHRGMTLASVRNSFFAIERSAIARNYSVHDVLCRLWLLWKNGFQTGRRSSCCSHLKPNTRARRLRSADCKRTSSRNPCRLMRIAAMIPVTRLRPSSTRAFVFSSSIALMRFSLCTIEQSQVFGGDIVMSLFCYREKSPLGRYENDLRLVRIV